MIYQRSVYTNELILLISISIQKLLFLLVLSLGTFNFYLKNINLAKNKSARNIQLYMNYTSNK